MKNLLLVSAYIFCFLIRYLRDLSAPRLQQSSGTGETLVFVFCLTPDIVSVGAMEQHSAQTIRG